MLYKWLARQLHTTKRRAEKRYKAMDWKRQLDVTKDYIEHAGKVKEPWHKRLKLKVPHRMRVRQGNDEV